jgi:ribosomal protein L40E
MGIKCENCGMDHKEDPGKFCERCGRVMDRLNIEPEGDASNFQVCGQCGHRNPLDLKICQNCGELLHSPRLG